MPVDRMRMRPWLEEQIDSGLINGLIWINKQKKIFQIPWLHAARHGWELDKDAPLFKNWAIHTGKYQPGIDQPDPKTWKANFRCAVNSLPDIEEVKDKSIKKGSNAFKVYRMLTAAERAVNKEKKKLEKKQNKSNKRKPANTSCNATDEDDKVEHEADSTVNIDPQPTSSVGYYDDQLLINEMQDVCAVVEVTTEHEGVSDSLVSMKREDPPVTSSTLYPRLQVSPISSCGESDAESEYSDQETINEEWDMRCLSEPQVTCSVVRFPCCKPPIKSTFFNSEKINFKVTSCQEESPMIAYNVRPWWRPHLATKPMPDRIHSGPRVQPRYSSPIRPQTLVRPQNAQQASEIHPPVHPHTSTQIPAQTSINVRTQTISYMIAQRSPHMPVQSSPHVQPKTNSPVLPQNSLPVQPPVAPQPGSHMPSSISPRPGLQKLYSSSPHIRQQSSSHGHTQTNAQLPLHPSVHMFPQNHSNTYWHRGLPTPTQAHSESSQMRILSRPDVSSHRQPDVIPHSSIHTSLQAPIIRKPHPRLLKPAPPRQSSPPESTSRADDRASVIVNTGVNS